MLRDRLYDDGRLVCVVIGCIKIFRDVSVTQLGRIQSLIGPVLTASNYCSKYGMHM